MGLVHGQPLSWTPKPVIRSQYRYYHFVLTSASPAHTLFSHELSLVLLFQDPLRGEPSSWFSSLGHNPLWVRISLLDSAAAPGPVSLGRCYGSYHPYVGWDLSSGFEHMGCSQQ